MRTFAVLLTFFVLLTPVRGASRVTVVQLEEFLNSSRTAKLSDTEIADRLSRVTLAEQLTSATLARILSGVSIGPKTAEQLQLLRATSIFEVPPGSELPGSQVPSTATQEEILGAAREYVNGALHLLPDLFAIRLTKSFDNQPVSEGKKHPKPTIAMHFIGEYRREIAVRAGREVNRPVGGAGDRGTEGLGGFSTRGEFGAILAIVLDDAFNGNVVWSRWQTSETGKRIAVFRYAIPRSGSHDTVDFCCYSKSEDTPAIYSFHDKPGYDGEIYIDPMSGEIDRITLKAVLSEDDPVTVSDVAVQYGQVSIGGKQYVCPIWSVAISELHNRAIEKIDGVGIERHVNVVQFRSYHKFGSTSRIVTTNP